MARVLLDLITGIIKPKKGSIYLSGQNMKNINIYSWREKITFYPSKVLLKRLLSQSIIRAHQKSECKVNAIYSFYIYDKPEQLKEILKIAKPHEHFESLNTFV